MRECSCFHKLSTGKFGCSSQQAVKGTPSTQRAVRSREGWLWSSNDIGADVTIVNVNVGFSSLEVFVNAWGLWTWG